MEVIELKELYENSVRSFTTLMLQMVQNHLNSVEGYDDVMQDHWANLYPHRTITDGTEVEGCLEFLNQLNKALKDAEVQTISNAQYFWNETDTPEIAEMLIGFIGYKVDDNLAECARMVKQKAQNTLNKAKKKRTTANYRKLLGMFMDDIIPMANDYGYDLVDEKKQLTLSGLYLLEWFKHKYWNEY